MPQLAADFEAARSLSSHWTNFEMHSWFMLVHFSWASTWRNSCRLFGRPDGDDAGRFLVFRHRRPFDAELCQHLLDFAILGGLFKFGQSGLAEGYIWRTIPPRPKHLAEEGHPVGILVKKGLGYFESLPAVSCPCRSPRTF